MVVYIQEASIGITGCFDPVAEDISQIKVNSERVCETLCMSHSRYQ